MFVPEIEPVAVKRATGEESAVHPSPHAAAEAVHDGTVRALDRLDEIPPYTGFDPPFVLEIRYLDPIEEEWWRDGEAERLDDRTLRIEGEHILDQSAKFGRVF